MRSPASPRILHKNYKHYKYNQMRKITSEACHALQNKYAYKLGNTEVFTNGGETVMLLHGHEIAKVLSRGLYIRSAGWETATTKERLNGIIGVQVQQKAGQWYLNGKKWENTSEWTKVESEDLMYSKPKISSLK